MNEQLSESIKLALEEVSKEYQEPEILDESFEDFDLDQIDENGPALQEVQDQIVQNNPQGSFEENIRKLTQKSQLTTNDSHMLKDKKLKLENALRTLLKEHPNDNQSHSFLIQEFVSQYFSEVSKQQQCVQQIQAPKPEVRDFCQQVDFDFEMRYKASKIDHLKTAIEKIHTSHVKAQELLDAQNEQICMLKSITVEQFKKFAGQGDKSMKIEIMSKQIAIQSKFYRDSMDALNQKTRETENTLQQQMFSQQMMENLINDLLDLAKMQNNTFRFNNSYFSLSNVIYEAFQMLRHSANENGIELRSEIDFQDNLQLIEAIDGDENRILQILLNFLSNSIKFTNRGGSVAVKIEILDQQLINRGLKSKDSSKSLQGSLSLGAISQLSKKIKKSSKSIHEIAKSNNMSQQEQDDFITKTLEREFHKNFPSLAKQQQKKDQIYTQGQERFINIKISVIDTGIGISEEGQKKLFIDFGKLDESSARNRKGTGLGLSICKQIIEQMGGSVDVNSKLGHGTEFIINIKTKCRVEKVQINENLLADLSAGSSNQKKLEKEFTFKPSTYSFVSKSRAANKQSFFKFIEKPLNGLDLKTCIEDQIRKHKSNQNESQIQQLQEFESKMNTIKSNHKQDIEKLICLMQRQQPSDTLTIMNPLGVKNRTSTKLPNQIDELQIEQEGEQEEFSLIHIPRPSDQSKLSSMPEQMQIVRIAGNFSFKDSFQDASSSDKVQANCSITSLQANNSLQSPRNNGNKTQQQRPERKDFQKSSLLLSEESRNLANSGSKGHIEEVEESKERSQNVIEQSISKRQYKVLIANDEPMQLYMLKVLFQMNDFEVVVAQNGHEAFAFVADTFKQDGSDRKQLFDLIILDLNMPISDGFETCKNIVNLYNDSNKFFRSLKNSSLPICKSEVDEQSREIRSKDNLQNQDMKPIIIAVTAEVINQDLLRSLKQIGFDSAYESPMKDAIIKSVIIPQLDNRQSLLSDKNQLLSIMIEGGEHVKDFSGSEVSGYHNRSNRSFVSQGQNNISNLVNNKRIRSVVVRKKSSQKIESRIQAKAKKKSTSRSNSHKNNKDKKQGMGSINTPHFQSELNVNQFRNYQLPFNNVEESKQCQQISPSRQVVQKFTFQQSLSGEQMIPSDNESQSSQNSFQRLIQRAEERIQPEPRASVDKQQQDASPIEQQIPERFRFQSSSSNSERSNSS